MSATKALMKKLPGMSLDELRKLAAELGGAVAAERNVMVRSSLSKRLEMTNKEIANRRQTQTA